jgi:hypothetical protein
MKRIESPGNRSAWSIVNSVMAENLGGRYDCMVGNSNPSVIESVQSMNGKFHASNGDRSLWVSDAHCPELCVDLDETVVEARRSRGGSYVPQILCSSLLPCCSIP